MKLEAWYKKKLKEFLDNVDFLTETAILDFTEKIVEKMQKSGMSRADLAAKLGVSKPFVTKLLNGNPNMTIRTMVSIAHALDCELNLAMCPKGFEVVAQASANGVHGKFVLPSVNFVELIKNNMAAKDKPIKKRVRTSVK